VKIETPIVVNILPILGMGITSYFVYRKTKSFSVAFGAGAIAAAIGFIPRLIMTKNALDEIRAENEHIRSKIKSDEEVDNINDGGAQAPVTSEKIFSVIESIAEKNGKSENLIPKREYFLSVLDSFSQEQKSAAYDMVLIISSLPKDPNEEAIAEMMQELSDLEAQYGKDFIETINARLNELSDEINSNNKEESKSLAV
jgi:hypothetical protein